MNPFEKIGVEHLSPSSINSWQASPAAWSIRYLQKLVDPPNDNMIIGTVVENIIRETVMGKKEETPDAEDDRVRGIINDWMERTHFVEDKSEPAARHMAEFGTETVQKLFNSLGKPTVLLPNNRKMHQQWRFELGVPGLAVPLIGYPDFVLSNGVIIEIKTAKAAPPKGVPRAAHLRQLALYVRCLQQMLAPRNPVQAKMHPLNVSGVIVYCLRRKKDPVLVFSVSPDDIDQAFGDLIISARKLQKFLGVAIAGMTTLEPDRKNRIAEGLMQLVPWDHDDFRLSNHDTDALRVLFDPDRNGALPSDDDEPAEQMEF